MTAQSQRSSINVSGVVISVSSVAQRRAARTQRNPKAVSTGVVRLRTVEAGAATQNLPGPKTAALPGS